MPNRDNQNLTLQKGIKNLTTQYDVLLFINKIFTLQKFAFKFLQSRVSFLKRRPGQSIVQAVVFC